jgi:hypothetical protein
MKASELIKVLKKAIKEHGDLPVYINVGVGRDYHLSEDELMIHEGELRPSAEAFGDPHRFVICN